LAHPVTTDDDESNEITSERRSKERESWE
jgi:hypothetical protein